jgi:hypothetical protein
MRGHPVELDRAVVHRVEAPQQRHAVRGDVGAVREQLRAEQDLEQLQRAWLRRQRGAQTDGQGEPQRAAQRRERGRGADHDQQRRDREVQEVGHEAPAQRALNSARPQQLERRQHRDEQQQLGDDRAQELERH